MRVVARMKGPAPVVAAIPVSLLSFSAFLLLAGCGTPRKEAQPPASQQSARQGSQLAPPAQTSTPTRVDPGTVVTTASGLRYVDLVVGSGPSPAAGETVIVHYTGWLKDGRKFDSSRDRGAPFEFPLGRGRVIKGWDEGIATMKMGGKRQLIIPPQLGYGSAGHPGVIPPNAELTFEVELLGMR